MMDIDTLAFILSCFFMDADTQPESMIEFVTGCDLPPPVQQFRSEPHKPIIDPTVCRVIAQGCERLSFRVGGVLDLTLPEEFQLIKAEKESETPLRMAVDWWMRHSNNVPLLAPVCSFRFLIARHGEDSAVSKRKSEILFEEYFAQRSKRERGSIEVQGDTVFWILASNEVSTADEMHGYQLAFVGNTDSWIWELWVEVSHEYLAKMHEIAASVIRSIRLVPELTL